MVRSGVGEPKLAQSFVVHEASTVYGEKQQHLMAQTLKDAREVPYV